MPSSTLLWHIYHVKNCRHTNPPKDKYVVIVHIEEGVALGCFINSGTTSWLRDRPYLMVCEAEMPGLKYRAIRYDSLVDCQKLYPFSDIELANSISPIDHDMKTKILRAIDLCPVLEGKYKKAILARERWVSG